jgi:hypothetical protein
MSYAAVNTCLRVPCIVSCVLVEFIIFLKSTSSYVLEVGVGVGVEVGVLLGFFNDTSATPTL